MTNPNLEEARRVELRALLDREGVDAVVAKTKAYDVADRADANAVKAKAQAEVDAKVAKAKDIVATLSEPIDRAVKSQAMRQALANLAEVVGSERTITITIPLANPDAVLVDYGMREVKAKNAGSGGGGATKAVYGVGLAGQFDKVATQAEQDHLLALETDESRTASQRGNDTYGYKAKVRDAAVKAGTLRPV